MPASLATILPALALMSSSVPADGSIDLWKASAPEKPLAVVYITGDLGLRLGLGGKVVPLLNAGGYTVATINSATAFRDVLSPQQKAALITVAAERAMAAAGARHFAIVGHSFGADIAPPAINVLPPAVAARLSFVALVVPSKQAYDHVSLGEITETTTPDRDALPAAAAITSVPRLCVSGAKEDEGDSLCPELAKQGYVWSVLPGGHHLNNTAQPLAAILTATLDRIAARTK